MNSWEIIIPAIWAGGLLSIGSLIFRRNGYRPESFFPAAGFLGLAIYGLGLIGAVYTPVFIAFTAIFAISTIWVSWKLIPGAYDTIKSHPLATVLSIVIISWFGVASLSYPVTPDALYFHLGLPKIYSQAGRIFFTPDNLFSASPRTSEMITTAFYSLGLERGAQLFIMVEVAILIWAIYNRAKDFGGQGLRAVLMVLTVPIFISQVTGSKNDFLLWGLSFFAILKFWDFIQSGKIVDLLWSGIGAGMAAGTKAIGLGIFASFAILILYRIIIGKCQLRHFFVFSIFFLLFASPWYIYSWLATGNPVFPFFDSIFHSPYSSILRENFNRDLAVPAIQRNPYNLLISPIQLVFNPEIYDGRLGYAIIAFPALLFCVKRIPYAIKTLIAFSSVFYMVWFFGFPFARFLLPVVSALAIAGSYFLISAEQESKTLKAIARISLAVAVIMPIPTVIRDTAPRVMAVVKSTPRLEFLSNYTALDPYQTQSGKKFRPFSYIQAWEFINSGTKPDSKIGILTSFLTRADGYYLDRSFFYLNPSEQRDFDFTLLRSDEEIEKGLRKLVITHIVIDSIVLEQFSAGSEWSGLPGFRHFSDGIGAFNSYCKRNGILVFSDTRYAVYQLP